MGERGVLSREVVKAGRPGGLCWVLHTCDLGRQWRPLELCLAVALTNERVPGAGPVCRGTTWEAQSRSGASREAKG